MSTEEEVGVGAAQDAADARDLGELGKHALALPDDLLAVGARDGEVPRLQRGLGERAGRAGDVVRRLQAVQETGNLGAREGRSQSDAREAKGLAQRLHHHQVGPLRHPLREAGALGREVDVRLIDHDDAVPRRVLQHLLNVLFADQVGRRVPGRADVDKFDVLVCREGLVDLVRLQLEPVGDVQRHLDDAHIIDVGADGVHAVRRGAGEDLVLAGNAETSQQSVDGLVRADADEEVLGSQLLLRVRVGVAKLAEQLLELYLVTEAREESATQ